MKPRPILFLLLSVCFGSYLDAQKVSEDSLRAIVRSELSRYNDLRAQIDKLALVAAKRVEAKKQYTAGNLSAVVQGFEVEEKQLSDYLKKHDLESASDKLSEIRPIYRDIPYVVDRIVFNKAQIDLERKQFDSAQKSLEDFITTYPDSEKLGAVITLLEKA